MAQSVVSEQKVLEEVKKAVVEALEIDERLVTPGSSLMKDLGAESLDFLDINYRLEQTFGIKMARHSILEHMEEMFGEESAIDSEGRLTEKAAKLLNLRFGDHNLSLLAGTDMDEIPKIVTVQSLSDAVMDIISTLPSNCPACSKSSWASDDGVRIKCGSCGENAGFTNGDDLVREWLEHAQETNKIF